MSKEITIIGGGLAGISLGIGLRKRNVPVKLIEAGQYPRHRVCGEFISGISEQALEYIGIKSIFDDTLRHQTSVWYFHDEKAFESKLPREAMGVSRYKLDKQLIDQFVEMGGKLSSGTRFKGGAAEGHVFATGRARQKGSQWMGIKCHLIDFPLEADLEMHIGDGAYIGFSGVEDNRVDACGLFKLRPDVKAPRLDLMASYLDACGLEKMADRIRTANKDDSSCLGVNAFQLGWQPEVPEESEKLRIGDLFAIIGPFSGNGMSMAFEGAAAAISPVESYAKGEHSWEECRSIVYKDLKNRFRTRLAVSNFLHPFLTDAQKQKLLIGLGKRNMIPYGTMFRALR